MHDLLTPKFGFPCPLGLLVKQLLLDAEKDDEFRWGGNDSTKPFFL